MSNEWKNPRFPSFEIPEESETGAPGKAMSVFTALLGLAILVSTNTFFIWAALQLLGLDVEYRKAVGVSILWIIFRVYDGVTLGKALSKIQRP
jgi:hypothetical protein